MTRDNAIYMQRCAVAGRRSATPRHAHVRPCGRIVDVTRCGHDQRPHRPVTGSIRRRHGDARPPPPPPAKCVKDSRKTRRRLRSMLSIWSASVSSTVRSRDVNVDWWISFALSTRRMQQAKSTLTHTRILVSPPTRRRTVRTDLWNKRGRRSEDVRQRPRFDFTALGYASTRTYAHAVPRSALTQLTRFCKPLCNHENMVVW